MSHGAGTPKYNPKGKVTEGSILADFVTDLEHAQDQLGLSDWEKDFVADMVRSKETLHNCSTKQKEKILSLAEKYL